MRRGLAAGVGGALLFAGCGQEKHYANDARPAVPISISAAVFANRVDVSPRRIGAGPITLTIANLSDKSLEVTLDAVGGTQAPSTSGPINPQGTAHIATDVKPGTYTLKSNRSGSATLRVGAARRSGSGDLLLP